MGKIKFSVIIPTRDRAETLHYCLKTILTQRYDNFEVIVSDNCSEDNTFDVVHSFNDRRVFYYRTEQRISMSHNFEFAATKATGEYISFLGDDDGLLPDTLEYVNELVSQYGRLPITNQCSTYYWGNNYINASQLRINMRSGVRVYDTKMAFKRLFQHKNYYASLPVVYYGFYPMELYQKIKERSKNNYFFNSMIPDVYSSIVTSFFVDKHMVSLKPLYLAGFSKSSNGQSVYFSKDEKEKLESKKFLNEAENIPFSSNMDFCLDSIPLLILESYFKVIESLDVKPILSEEEIHKYLIHLYSKEVNIKVKSSILKTLRILDLPFDQVAEEPRKFNFSSILNKFKNNKMQYRVIQDEKVKTIYDAALYHHKFYNSHSHFFYNLFRRISEILQRNKNL